MDFKQGLLCGLTNLKPAFEKDCENFNLDETVKVRNPDDTYILTSNEIKNRILDKILNQLILEQNFPAAIITGFLSSIVGAGIWAIVTITTGFQIGFMAIGVGALVGFTVRIFGKGITKKFGIIGALFALFGCVLGNVFSFTALIADYYKIEFWSVFSQLTLNQIVQMMREWFTFVDILFYSMALVEGYKFALKQITEKTLKFEFKE